MRFLMLLVAVPSMLFAVQTVKIGVLAKRSEETAFKEWAATAAYLSERVGGTRFEVVPLGFDALKESIARHEVDFVLTNTMSYVTLEYLYGVSRIATLKNRSSTGAVLTEYGGVVFTKRGSGIVSPEALKGKRFGAVDPDSFGGWVMAEHMLAQNGVERDDFAALRFFGSHDEVVKAVGEGRVDAGTVRTDTLERMAGEGKIDPSVFLVLAPKRYVGFPFSVSTALYPEWPFAKLRETPEQLANRVAIALLQMPRDAEAARAAHLEGWTIPLDYAKVHALLETMQIGPYAERGALTLPRFYEKYRPWFVAAAAAFAAIMAVLFVIARLNRRLREKQEEIAALNGGLEQKVLERTAALERLYRHEKYLEETLRTVAEVNEALIASFSAQTVLRISVAKLAEHPDYACVWIGLPSQEILEAGMKTDGALTFERVGYRYAADRNPDAFVAAAEVLQTNRRVVGNVPRPYRLTLHRTRYDKSACRLAALPLHGGAQTQVLGVLTVCSERGSGFEPEELKMLENLANDIGLALHAIAQRTELEKLEKERIANYEETILAFVNIIEQRDSYTAGHTVRVAKYCRRIAEAMEIGEEQIVLLEKAAILHDIGKVVTPDAILLKPDRLTPLEYELIKLHAEAGYQMLSKIDMYRDLAQIIRYHHARYDGKGYPLTPERDAVPLVSYIMAAADAFDAMTTNRVYKQRKSVAEAVAELQKCAGTQFHPEVAAAAVRALAGVHIADTTQMPESRLEQQRFAYFFRDALTGCFNEDYLHTILIQHEDEQRCLNVIDLKRFSAYNKASGWEAGNRLLQNVAAALRERYGSAKIFRYHGDNFILLFEAHRDVSREEIAALAVLRGTGIGIDLRHYDLEKGIPSL